MKVKVLSTLKLVVLAGFFSAVAVTGLAQAQDELNPEDLYEKINEESRVEDGHTIRSLSKLSDDELFELVRLNGISVPCIPEGGAWDTTDSYTPTGMVAWFFPRFQC